MTSRFSGTSQRAVRPQGRPKKYREIVNDPNYERTSYFFLTINSQKVYKAGAEFDRFEERFEASVETLLQTEELFDVLKGYKGPYDDYSDLDVNEAVKSVNVFTQLEIGNSPKGRRLHSHSLIKIVHKGKVTFDCPEIQEYFSTAMPEINGKVYVNVKRVKDNVGNLFGYVQKTHSYQPRKNMDQLSSTDLKDMFSRLSIK